MPQQQQPSLKLKTARTLKWNAIDKIAQQVLYAVTGIVLANIVSQEDFGLVGVMLVFQAFAALFVDSGFSNALVQRKSPTATDYSTVFWFNLAMSVAIYAVLWLCAPLIDTLFHAGGRLVPLSRVMFLTFILNATAIVQTNRLIKQMDVRMVAVSDLTGLVVSGVAGVWLAVSGYGAWAIVWQSVILSGVKSAVLWLTTGWRPAATFSYASLKAIFKVGAGVMASSALNIIFLNIYSFIIGLYYSLTHLGCYTQADKWSKMGMASLSSILTSTFLPILSDCQDDRPRLFRVISKTNHLSAYMVLPCMLMLFVAAPAIFHVLFAHKWDNAILLFQLLVLRGIFVVLAAVYSNCVLAVGDARRLVECEVVKDVVTVAAIVVTLPMGITALVAGQVAAAVVCWLYSAWLAYRSTGYHWFVLISEAAPYAAMMAVAAFAAKALELVLASPWLLLPAQLTAGFGIYLALGALCRNRIQAEALDYALGRFRRRRR